MLVAVVMAFLRITPVHGIDGPTDAADTAAAEVNDTGVDTSAVENDRMRLTVDMGNGTFSLMDKENGKTWHSVPENPNADKISIGIMRTNVRSHILMEYINREDENTDQLTQTTNSYIQCESEETIQVTKQSDAYRVEYTFQELGIRIPLVYTLKEDCLQVSIDVAGIDEGNENRIVSIALLPYFGAADQTVNGYLFIPDGCGAVAEFNRNIIPLKAYEKMIYGSDLAHSAERQTSKEMDIRLPVFGTVQDNGAGLMGVITEGDGAASIHAETGSAKVNYNYIYSKMIRRIYSIEKSLYVTNKKNDISTITYTDFGTDHYTVCYYPLSGEDASYSGMAAVYRDFLAETYSMQPNKVEHTLSLKVYGALEEQKNFLGIHYYKKQALTRFDELQNILKDLQKNGVDDLSIQLLGWTGNGVYNRKISTDCKPLRVLGGKQSFAQLSDYIREQGFALYPDVDLLTYTKGGNRISVTSDSAKAPNGDNARQYAYSIVTQEKRNTIDPCYLLRPQKISSVFSDFLRQAQKTGVTDISFSGIGSMLYSDFKKSDGTYRVESLSIIQKSLDQAEKQQGRIAVSGGNAYTLPYVDRVFEAPAFSSGYDIFSYDVPFYQMVLQGYASYTLPPVIQSGEQKTMLLKAAETGSDLLYACIAGDSYRLRETRLSAMYSAGYDLWKSPAIDAYASLKELYVRTGSSVIVHHERLAEELYRTTYDNGVQVLVNYSANSTEYAGQKIDGESFVMSKAAE